MALLKKIEACLTKEDIIAHLRGMGIKQGMVLEIHSSLSSFGYVIGGARVVVDALMECVGEEGTICMPLQDRNNTEPSYWEHPPIAHELMREVRNNMPIFHPVESDVGKMGAIVENFRRRKGVEFSYHPNAAFVAWGLHAKFLCQKQSWHFPLAEHSPLARLYELDASILLIGVGYQNCTALHLAEYRSDEKDIILQGASYLENGNRVWKKFLDMDSDTSIFDHIGGIIEKYQLVQIEKIGGAPCRLFSFRQVVDVGERYFRIA